MTDGFTQSDTQVLSITVVVAPLTITTASLPAGELGVFYSQTLQASGGAPPYVWSLASGALPRGLTLSPSGTISGTPNKRGNYSFTVRVTAGTQVTKAFSIRINR